MAVIDRVRAVWSGSTVVGGGLSTFYFNDADTGMAAAVRAFFNSMTALIPPGTSIQVENAGDIFESTTGALLGSWAEDAVSPVVGAASPSSYAAGVGARIVWRTNGIVGSRRVVGSTFVCPMGIGVYEADGTLGSGAIALMQTAVTNLLSPVGSEPLIWHRPKGGSGGAAYAIEAGVVPDKISWLRSRRT